MAIIKITDQSLASDAVKTAKILDNNVTLAKLGDGTQGDVLYYGASGAPARLGFGTSGDFLKTQGTGANPTWATAGGGSWTYISTTTISTATDVSVTAGIDSTYDVYKVIISGLTVDTDDSRMNLQFYVGGSLHTASNYYYAFSGNHSSGGGGDYGGQDVAFILFNYDSSESASTASWNSEITIFNPSSTAFYKSITYKTISRGHTGYLFCTNGSGMLESTTALTGFKVYRESGGNLTGGKIRLYGVNNS